MTKYSIDIQLDAVQSYLEGIESFKDIAKRYGVGLTTLKKWVARYRLHGPEGLEKDIYKLPNRV
jgi:transposase